MKALIKNTALILMSLLTFNQAAQATCQVGDYKFQVNLSEETMNDANTYEQAFFSEQRNDHVSVINTKTGREYIFDIGMMTDDGAGNFGIDAISSADGTAFSVFHDHEDWHNGLSGDFSLPSNEIIDLSSVKDCDYDSLF